MTIRRSAAAASAVALGLFALSACSKPTPLATVTVGKGTVNTEATCYNNGKPLTAEILQSCLSKQPTHTVKVRQTDTIHLGVEPAMAKNGWLIIGNSMQKTNLIKDTYRSFSGQSLFIDQTTGQPTSSVVMNIVESAGDNSSALGVWKFKMELQS
ncbi:MAG: hypothetical protein JO362_11950 [Streptomycetaceae bacterium]|nr:hypothetical protein [Streptomycetaceae bacterium]